MEWLNSALNFFTDLGQTVVDFFNAAPSIFQEIVSYWQLLVMKAKVTSYLWWLQVSYNTAQILLNELGFNQLISWAFNSLNDELRYYAFLFGIPKAITIYINFFTTAFVMRMTR